jgi:hypothetical protein
MCDWDNPFWFRLLPVVAILPCEACANHENHRSSSALAFAAVFLNTLRTDAPLMRKHMLRPLHRYGNRVFSDEKHGKLGAARFVK